MKRFQYILLSVAATTMAACSSGSDYERGWEVKDDCMQVYFADYEDQYVQEENDDSVVIPLKRVLTTQTDTVIPLNVYGCSKYLEVPTTATFKAGSDSTSLVVWFKDLPKETKADFNIGIPQEYCNPYTSEHGIPVLQSSVLKSSWKTLVDSVVFVSSCALYPDQGTRVEYLPGAGNRFRFKDFLGSGNSLEFSLTMDEGVSFDSKNLRNNHGRLNPLSYYYPGSNDYGGFWTWTNDGAYTEWQPKNSTNTISRLDFYNEYYGTKGDYIDFRCENPDEYIRGGQTYYMDFDHTGVELTTTYLNNFAKSTWDYIYIYNYYLTK